MMTRSDMLSAARLAVLVFSLAAGLPLASHAQPITTDTRIKTFVYNANEVFTVTTHYGYQSNIEFGPRETIETVSIGDRVAWQISPAGRRLFIRAQEENARTNMTVVTNKRAYQFDLKSSSANAVFGSEELTYVVRFYYPEDADGGTLQAVTAPPPPVVQPLAPNVSSVAPNTVLASPSASPSSVRGGLNYRYTFSGPSAAAPLKIFDDGKRTYFKFSNSTTPKISILSANGEVLDVPTQRTHDGLIAVNATAARFSVRQGGQQVVVYNEASGVL